MGVSCRNCCKRWVTETFSYCIYCYILIWFVISRPIIGAGFHIESFDSIFLKLGSICCCSCWARPIDIISLWAASKFSTWGSLYELWYAPPSYGASERLKLTSLLGGGGYAPPPKFGYGYPISLPVKPVWLKAPSTYLWSSASIFCYANYYSAGSKIFIASKLRAHTLLIKTFLRFSYIICLFLF